MKPAQLLLALMFLVLLFAFRDALHELYEHREQSTVVCEHPVDEDEREGAANASP